MFSCCQRPGSIIANMAATLLNHPQAEPIFFGNLASLDLSRSFPESGAVVPNLSNCMVFHFKMLFWAYTFCLLSIIALKWPAVV